MDTVENNPEANNAENVDPGDDSISAIKSKCRNRGKKRKRSSSCSSSDHDTFPENILEVEKNLQEAAVRNNLDKESVRKIIKKVVCNDHVLALVKLQEEEESADNVEDKSLRPKLTRAKAKELMKVSTKPAPWCSIELTPIKHIPVKTRPEVKALIAQELPDDEDDEEYKPTPDDVLSDDDHTIESCSDVDSQPRTPATPNSQCTPSPKVLQDGPFKVPQSASSVVRRKLNLPEEPTIALRTRSKLSLSTTSIEHIESSFIPPDEPPNPVVDVIWNQFLAECLNPGPSTKHEDDDETDPEYSVAADPDANDEDEEALENSIIKISKKELNDLMTELFEIIPESTADKIAESLASDGILQNSTSRNEISWEGKQEPISDEETQIKKPPRLKFEKDNTIRYSVGKTEMQDYNENDCSSPQTESVNAVRRNLEKTLVTSTPKDVEITVKEQSILQFSAPDPPPVLKLHDNNNTVMDINVSVNVQILPEQIQIVQQQLRQHIQLAACNYLQLYVNPVHWALAPQYKEYIETFHKMHQSNPHSIVNVSNMTPAWELVLSWEKSVSDSTPENNAMIDFIQKEADRCRRRAANNSLYVGNFHDTFLNTVANSIVFQYPYLLPAMPYRPENPRKALFLTSEDSLIALGLDQFWDYVDNNLQLFKLPLKRHPRKRTGLTVTLELIKKHMMPWITTRKLMCHINRVKKTGGPDNPINKWFAKRTVEPVKHKIIPISPNMTLYEQPEDELPKIWVRHLAKSSKRFRKYLHRRPHSGTPADGIPVNIGQKITVPHKTPLPIEFTKPILANRINLHPKKIETLTNRIDINITPQEPTIYTLNQRNTSNIVPLNEKTSTVNSNNSPITSAIEIPIKPKPQTDKPKIIYTDHCPCCSLIRKTCKRQTKITEFITKNKRCPCKDRKQERITNRLRLLITNYKKYTKLLISDIDSKIDKLNRSCFKQASFDDDYKYEPRDLEFVSTFQQRLMIRMVTTRDTIIKRKFLTCLDKFNLEKGDPIQLARNVENIFDVELVDMYKEFLSFLTAEQAAKIDKFKDYFVHHCVKDLLEKVEEQISNKKHKEKILLYLKSVINNKENNSNECEICVKLLNLVGDYPKLAEYVFSLFPHNRLVLATINTTEVSQTVEDKTPTDKAAEQNETVMSHCIQSTTMDYEADHSSSDEEEIEMLVKEEKGAPNECEGVIVKMEAVSPQREEINETINLNSNQHSSVDSDISMQIVIEEEMKNEPLEWKREEDKLILEVLKQNMQERKDKVSEILEDRSILNSICELLPHKSQEDVKERMVLILEMLVFSGNK